MKEECRVWSLRSPSGWVRGIWVGTVERGKKKGWYKIKFPGGVYSGKTDSYGDEGGPFDGRRRKRPLAVHPDRVSVEPWNGKVEGQQNAS